MHISTPLTLAIATPTVALANLVEPRTTEARHVAFHAHTPSGQGRLRSNDIAEESANSSDPARSRGQDVSRQLIDRAASPAPPFTKATFGHPILNMLSCPFTDAGQLNLTSAPLRISSRTTILNK